jgi:hypothetical protein
MMTINRNYRMVSVLIVGRLNSNECIEIE